MPKQKYRVSEAVRNDISAEVRYGLVHAIKDMARSCVAPILWPELEKHIDQRCSKTIDEIADLLLEEVEGPGWIAIIRIDGPSHQGLLKIPAITENGIPQRLGRLKHDNPRYDVVCLYKRFFPMRLRARRQLRFAMSEFKFAPLAKENDFYRASYEVAREFVEDLR